MNRELDKKVWERLTRQRFDPNSSYPWDGIRAYSTDIAAAWEIVEKSNTRLILIGPRSIDNRWVAAFSPHPEADGATAAEAICNAFLKAMPEVPWVR